MMTPGPETAKWLAEVKADREKIRRDGGCDFLLCGFMGPWDLCDFCKGKKPEKEATPDEPEWSEEEFPF